MSIASRKIIMRTTVPAYKSIVCYALGYKVNNREGGRTRATALFHGVCSAELRVGNKKKKMEKKVGKKSVSTTGPSTFSSLSYASVCGLCCVAPLPHAEKPEERNEY